MADALRDMLFDMKATKTPKGVWFSTFMMSAPLVSATCFLAMMSPMAANAAIVDPQNFAYVSRSCLRMLSLNISFFGGIHYGLASATFDTARTPEEASAIKLQMFYSFVPAFMAYCSTNFLLFSSPLTVPVVIYSFTSLMLTQLVSLKFDHYCVSKEMAPIWFKKYRSSVFAIYMLITSLLFSIYYTHVDIIQRKNDKNRIANLKNALQLEDVDFVKMVDELKLEFDDGDLREVEQ